MDQMGRKDAAREIAVEAGVPVVPRRTTAARRRRPSPTRCWSRPRPAVAARACGSCASAEEYAAAVASAQREAPRAFGDDTILIEKYVEHGRHIEVQVLADAPRQRGPPLRARLLDPAPAPEGAGGGAGADDHRRTSAQLVTEAAVALAAARSATRTPAPSSSCSTTTPARCYFLEMNTRLQVEHPVTESVVVCTSRGSGHRGPAARRPRPAAAAGGRRRAAARSARTT